MAPSEKAEIEEGGTTVNAEDLVKEGTNYTLPPEESKSLLRKIDRCLLPVMAISYFFQFLDKIALNSTAILGIREDLNLTGGEYSWAGGIYYIGYLLASYPAGALMVRWKVGKTISTSVLVWGGILMLTALSFNAAGLLATRFMLGVAEAVIAPGLTIVISMWYKREEQPLRHAAWFMGNTFAGIFGSLIQYGIGHIQTIAPWKAVFLILGAITVSWSVAVFFLLPDTPMDAWFLNQTDRSKAVARVNENLTGIKNNEFKWAQCFEALMDPKTWFIFCIQVASNIPNGGVTTFSSIVIKGLGFSTFNTLLLNSVSYILQLIMVLLCTTGSTYLPNTRTYFMAFNYAVALVGAAMVRELPESQKWARFAGTCLLTGYSASFPLKMALMSGNFAGFTKKTTVYAISFIGYCAGNIIGPHLFFEHEAPTYTSAFLAMMICPSIGIVLALSFRVYLVWVNRCRDKAAGGSGPADTTDLPTGIALNLMDKTDMEMPQFRYVY
ncbi:hypothetical protein ASPSYDRAFT_91969 [Aspergillus sydowii CBS 593.65]|uniref:Major facilitator superfamily (MFS) profile domain-containing protein n=1 Tax=Aspergillus sydowii CBS 593.65 TaxID=1036612 RepID=A0A1L9TBD6_9EURO|nr:uncharacterized protein ASPSYDRAFT_91969 [Aspergillus sydowii CBS 593.65]OJJ56721.1 hypothetical protein ASPSYDRAFT_91969 [Aspergillus sydowii CBS 593.65]